MDPTMRYGLMLFFLFFGVSALAASTFKDVSRTANVYQRETPADAESGAWWGPGTAAVDYDNDGCWLDIFVVGDGGLPNALLPQQSAMAPSQTSPRKLGSQIRLTGAAASGLTITTTDGETFM